MSTRILSAAAVAAAVLAAAPAAFAQDSFPISGSLLVQYNPYVTLSKTREQVQAELKQAQADGSITRVSDANNGRYTPVVSTKTREQVKAELAEAVRTGDIVVGDSSLTLREQFPNAYRSVEPAHPLVATSGR